jgi:hypothetical protein
MSKGKIRCICQTCNGEFFVKPSAINAGGGKYCSPECTYINPDWRKKQSENKKGEKHPLFGKIRPKKTCVKISESRKGNKNPMFGKTGDKDPAWKGGISFEPYCVKFNREFKERVRAFFGYRCVKCGKSQSGMREKLHVHHVNFDKQSCCNDTKPLFVPLCRSCHSKTQRDRDGWERYFTEMIYENDPTGKCFLTKEEMLNYAK